MNNNFNYGGTFMPQPPRQQPMPYPTPFQDVRCINSKEVDGYIVFPNQRVLLIDNQAKKFYIKWSDSMGYSTTETYSFERVDNPELKEPEKEKFDTSQFVNRDEFKNVVTKDEFNSLKQTIQDLEKQVKISQILTEKKGE